MATTAKTGELLQVVGTSLRSAQTPYNLAHGRAVLASGAATVATGLSTVSGFWITESGTLDANDVCVFQVNEDLPSADGSITVSSRLLVDDAGSGGDEVTTNASGAQWFCWLAIGEK